jgi:uncharacterized protein YbaP (TraB family)
MKGLQFMIIGILVLMAACKGSKDAADAGQEIPERTNDVLAAGIPADYQSLFWEIRHKDALKPSYLFGTIHIIGAEDFFLGDNVKDKLIGADRLVMEIDFDEMDINAMADLGLLAEGRSMRDYLPEEDYDLVAKTLSDSIGLSRMSFESVYSRMKPLFLEQLVIYKFLGENPMSYENEFEFLAEANGVESEGLESFDDQLRFLDQIPLEQQYEDLLNSIRNWADTREQFNKLLDAYKQQDLNSLHYIIEEEMESEEMRELLLEKRNTDWIPQLKGYLEQGNAFIAVGAGHLAGDQGLIALLRAAGYEIRPLPQGEYEP